MKEDNKDIKSKEQPKQQQPKAGKCNKILTASLLILMSAVGVASVIIGVLNLDRCGCAMMIPVLLLLNGLLWLLPPLLVAVINCLGRRYGDDLICLHGCLEKLFFFSLLFIVASTIYLLVTVTQVKTLDSLCTRYWLPPYALCLLVADWLCFFVFVRLFCAHPVPAEQPPAQFKHLKNLPPLSFPWNRHRAVRTY